MRSARSARMAVSALPISVVPVSADLIREKFCHENMLLLVPR